MGNFNFPYRVPTGILDMYQQLGGPWYTTINSRTMTFLGSDIKSGQSLPGFADRIRKGIDATTSYTRESFDVSPGRYSSLTFSRLGNYYGLRNESFCNYSNPNLSFSSSDVVNDASARLKNKLREFTGQSNQMANVAELKDLPRTIRTASNAATKLVSSVLNSNRRGADLRKFASDQWLNFSFGILPTLAAVDDAISSVNDYLSRGDHRIKEYGIQKKEWRSGVNSITTGPYHHNIRMIGDFKHSLSCKITAGYKFNLLSSNSYTPAKHLGFDISQVVPTAWQLLPYSWLVDYFTTAGSFIEDTFTADPGQSIYLCQNVLFRVEGTITPEIYSLFPSYTNVINWSSKPCKFIYYKFTRTPLSNLPRAPLRFKTSDEIAHNAVTKLLNLTALLGNRR